jgi:hypothetical protein
MRQVSFRQSPRLSQISGDETCGLIDERSNRFIREHFRAVQNRSMGQRLYRRRAYECRKSQVNHAKFIAVGLKTGPEESVRFAIDGSCILQASNARKLLSQDAMQLGVDAMRLDRYGNKPAHCFLNRLRGDLRQRAPDDLHKLLIMTIDDGGNERLLAWVILVKRANAHARLFGDSIGAGAVETFPDQNASGRFTVAGNSAGAGLGLATANGCETPDIGNRTGWC